jgi:hypothetical protein
MVVIKAVTVVIKMAMAVIKVAMAVIKADMVITKDIVEENFNKDKEIKSLIYV